MNKILVTGATGFIGNYVVEELLRMGHSVVATSVDKSKATSFKWFNSVEYFKLDFKEINNSVNYYEYFQKPDVLIHLAWEGLPNYMLPFHFEDNLPRHYGFLKNIIINGCADVTVTGTCFEYGMKEGELYEDMCTCPHNAYALSKDSLNKFLTEFRKGQIYSLKWVRLFYLFGKGQNPKSLFSQLDKALENNEKIFNMSGGEQVRDYLPIEKAAKYIVKIALQNKVTGSINCCSNEPLKLKNIVSNYLREKGGSIELNLGYYPYPEYEPMTFWGNNEKLQSILNEQ